MAKLRAERKQKRRKKLQKHKMANRPNAVGPADQNFHSGVPSILDVVASIKATQQSNLSNNDLDSSNHDISNSKSLQNISTGKNGAPKNKLESFSRSRKEVSVDSSDSCKFSLETLVNVDKLHDLS